MGKTKKKNTKKKGGLKYKMNKRTISLKGENKKQDIHEEKEIIHQKIRKGHYSNKKTTKTMNNTRNSH
jgi:hypothetical protein